MPSPPPGISPAELAVRLPTVRAPAALLREASWHAVRPCGAEPPPEGLADAGMNEAPGLVSGPRPECHADRDGSSRERTLYHDQPLPLPTSLWILTDVQASGRPFHSGRSVHLGRSPAAASRRGPGQLEVPGIGGLVVLAARTLAGIERLGAGRSVDRQVGNQSDVNALGDQSREHIIDNR